MRFRNTFVKCKGSPVKQSYFNMLGLAQKRFSEQGGTLNRRQPKWPLIDRMLSLKCLSYIDFALAEKILRNFPQAGEEAAALICYLSLAVRSGHLCTRIDACGIFPKLQQIGSEISDGILSDLLPKELLHFESAIIKGVEKLPGELIAEVPQQKPNKPICRFGNLFYLQRNWVEETFFVEHFLNVSQGSPEITLDAQTVEHHIASLTEQGKLLPEQAEAIRIASAGGLTVICGGPGTGKTYTAGHLIKIYWMSMPPEQRRNCEIALAAPTGKAAANLQQCLYRSVQEIEGFPPLKAKTLHSLLGINNFKSGRNPIRECLTSDLVLVDESSMIDANLMGLLFRSVKPGARLILLGDRYQLPPVASGTLFADIIDHLTAKNSKQAVILNRCMRAELHDLVHFAGLINQGDGAAALHMLSQANTPVSRTPFSTNKTSSAAQKELVDYALPFFLAISQVSEDVFGTLSRFRILSPLRQGPFGVDAMNTHFVYSLMQKMRNQEWFAAPIMIASNDHRLELFNGEVGVLVRRMPNKLGDLSLQEGDYALFPNLSTLQGESKLRRLPALLLPKYEYAYCLSVHKSQGSEFDHVLLLIPSGAEAFGREILYTAATRARKKLEIWGSDSTLLATVGQQRRRLSGVTQRTAFFTTETTEGTEIIEKH